jgi:hypothetical protein
MRTTLSLAALAVVLAAPALAQDWSLEPTFGNVELSEGFLPDPHEVALTAGGAIVPGAPGCDFGYVAEAPDFDLYYETSGGTTLYIYAVSGSDTTILINAPDQSWLCDDDGYGEGDPLVVIPNAPAGLYDIWVGTLSEDAADATLYISEMDPRASD